MIKISAIYLSFLMFLIVCPNLVTADVHPPGEDCSGPVCDAIEECEFLIKRFGSNPTLFEYIVGESDNDLVSTFCKIEGFVVSQISPFDFLPNNKNTTKFSAISSQFSAVN